MLGSQNAEVRTPWAIFVSMPRRLLIALLACACLAGAPIRAQVRPIYDRGAAGLTQILQRLTTIASVLHVGAHPDDEDSAFLARAARGVATCWSTSHPSASSPTGITCRR